MLDLILRGGAIGTITVIPMVLMLHTRPATRLASVAFCAALIVCYLIVSAPAAAGLGAPLGRGLEVAATLVPLSLTWMMLDLLTDPPFRRWPWIALSVLTVTAALLGPVSPAMSLLRGVLVIALYVGLMALAVVSDRTDLVDVRRRLRRGILVIMAALGVVISAVEVSGLEDNLPNWIFPLQAAAFWVLGLICAGWALRAGPVIGEPSAPETPRPDPDPGLVDRLAQVMAAGAWRQEGLTIGALAADLGVQEHRLRTAINRDLGHRNFPSFVNGYRVTAAKEMLGDPAHRRTTILEIAFECGFASLGPFNRAFRDQTGQSPREYRAAVSSASQPINAAQDF